MDDQQSNIDAHGHHLQRSARCIVAEEHQAFVLPDTARDRQFDERILDDLAHSRLPDPMPARGLGELDMHPLILHDRIVKSSSR